MFCFYLIIQYHEHHRAVFFENAYQVSGWVFGKQDQAVGYFSLRRVNDSLMAENARLREETAFSFYKTLHHLGTFNDSILKQKFRYIPAKVINNSVNKTNNFFTLDRGKIHDVSTPAGVITSNGVAGIITHASPHFSAGMSVLHQDFTLSVQIKESGHIGSLQWEGRSPDILTVTDIPRHHTVKVGQQIVTSPYSRLFPEGIDVGEIIEHEIDPITNFYRIIVRPSVEFRDLKYGYIIQNNMAGELLELENEVQ